MMKIFGYVLLILVLCQSIGFAQSEEEQVIFKAMEDEMQRNMKELQLSNVRPCYMEYLLMKSKGSSVTASLGSIKNVVEDEVTNTLGVRLLVGDYQMSSDLVHTPTMYGDKMPEELDYDGLRRSFWFVTDFAYKEELKSLENKKTYYQKNPIEGEFVGLPDFSALPEVTKTILKGQKFNFDLAQWKKNVKELSAIFKNYSNLYATTVNVYGFEKMIYKRTSDGVVIRQPQTYIHVLARATVRTKEEMTHNDQYCVIVPMPEDLPDMETLKKGITDFAEELSKFNNTVCLDEPYEGPVLFVGEVTYEAFHFNVMTEWTTISKRPGVGVDRPAGWHGQMGEQVLSKLLTVRNYASMKEYQGQPLHGAYEIDAEGVKPDDGIVLIENGVLKARLNNRIPDVEDPRSTGSCRLSTSLNGIRQETAPGVVHITASKTMKADKMKDALMKEAKKQKLDYAYIYRRTNRALYVPYLYRVNVKTGEETLVTNARLLSSITLKDKKVVGFSDKEVVSNVLWRNFVFASFIHPESILLKKERIDIVPVRAQPKEVVER